MPTAVATAILPLIHEPPEYLNVSIVANRGSEQIPVKNPFYNVTVSPGDKPMNPEEYQAIPSNATSLYLTLPPRPGTTPINLEIPADGSAPPFDDLIGAMEQVLPADETLSAFKSKIGELWPRTDLCTRLAYEIVWSNQNKLPPPPDLLGSLYTNPPNTGFERRHGR